MIRFLLLTGLRLLAILVLLAAGLFLGRDILLRHWLVHRLETVTGLNTEIAHLQLGFRSGTLTLRDLRLHNAPEFGDRPLIVIPDLRLEWDAQALHRREWRLHSARLHVAEFNLVRNAQGETNVFALRRTVEERAGVLDAAVVRPPGLTFAGIDRLNLTLDTVRLIDLKPPGGQREFQVGLTNEVVQDVRTVDDLSPLLVRVVLAELSKAWQPLR